MKDFINILLILILTGFAIGLTKLIVVTKLFLFGWLYAPIFVLMIMLSVKLYDNYN